jgi:hypothetical protein
MKTCSIWDFIKECVPSNLELLFLVKDKIIFKLKKDSTSYKRFFFFGGNFFVQDTQMKLYKRL